MKIWILAVSTGLVGVVAGASSAWLEFVWTSNQFEPHNQPAGAFTVGESDRIGPQVFVIGGTEYDFGLGQRDSSLHHTFVFRNDGDEPLRLTHGSSTCKCTMSQFDSGELQPGETTEMRLDFKLVTMDEQFRQTAEVLTNDPRQPTVTLTIVGTVTDLLRLEPRDVVLSNVPANEGAEATVYLYGFGIEDLQVVSQEFTNSETASRFSLDWTPVSTNELDGKPGASVGLKGTLTAKPGLPLGPINQTIQLGTNMAEADKLELEIRGTVVSDISIVGPSVFNDKHNAVIFGIVDRSQGAKTTLRILVKGPHRRDVKLTVDEIDPADVLSVSLGEAREINVGAVFMYPLEIEIPPDSRTVNRLGSDQAKLGRIVIGTTHPTVSTVPISVKFAVE